MGWYWWTNLAFLSVASKRPKRSHGGMRYDWRTALSVGGLEGMGAGSGGSPRPGPATWVEWNWRILNRRLPGDLHCDWGGGGKGPEGVHNGKGDDGAVWRQRWNEAAEYLCINSGWNFWCILWLISELIAMAGNFIFIHKYGNWDLRVENGVAMEYTLGVGSWYWGCGVNWVWGEKEM